MISNLQKKIFTLLSFLCLIGFSSGGWCGVPSGMSDNSRNELSRKTLRDAVDLYVDPAMSDDTGNGLSWEAAKKTISGASEAATWNSTIHLKNATHVLTQNIQVPTSLLWVNENGDNDFQQCIINLSEFSLKMYSVENSFTGITFDGANNSEEGGGNIVIGQNATGIFSFCKFSNNENISSGGAVLLYGNGEDYAEGRFSYCEFSSNKTGKYGGAIGGTICKVSCENCIFQNNESGGGAAVAVGLFSSPVPCEASFTACSFLNNSGDNEGALYLRGGNYKVNDCTFEENKASGEDGVGGAIVCTDAGEDTDIVISNTIFLKNTSGSNGGAVRIANSNEDDEEKKLTFTVTDTLFSYNTAQSGGGMHCGRESVGTVRKCAFFYNKALGGNGGALHNGGTVKEGGGMTVEYCLFYKNDASYRGGGMFIALYPWTDIQNCTFYENTAVANGDQIAGEPHAGVRKATLTNTICWGSRDNDQILGMEGNAFDSIYFSCFPKGKMSDAGAAMDHNINDDPLFMDPDNPDPGKTDFTLNPASGCIDSGIDIGLFKDFAGNTVPFGEGPDMGAYEFSFLNGDVDCSGKLDLGDAILAAKISSGQSGLGTCVGAEINGDSRVGTEEIIFILSKLASGKGDDDTPSYTPAQDMGCFLWQDNNTGKWHLRFSGDSINTHTFTGIISGSGLGDVDIYSFEESDEINIGETMITFTCSAGAGEDGFAFSAEAGSRISFDLYINEVREIGNVYIGKESANPGQIPFVLPVATTLSP